jgi:hypothetical protein
VSQALLTPTHYCYQVCDDQICDEVARPFGTEAALALPVALEGSHVYPQG